MGWFNQEVKEMGIDEKISTELSKICPLFYKEIREFRASLTLWHDCFCLGRASSSSHGSMYQYCDCVCDETDTCPAGKWAQLDFIPPKPLEIETIEPSTMEDAKKACKASNKEYKENNNGK